MLATNRANNAAALSNAMVDVGPEVPQNDIHGLGHLIKGTINRHYKKTFGPTIVKEV